MRCAGSSRRGSYRVGGGLAERLLLGVFGRSLGVVVKLNPSLRMRHRLVRRGLTLPKARPERLLVVECGRSAFWEAASLELPVVSAAKGLFADTLPKNADATSLKVADCFQQSRTCEAAPRYNLHDVALPRTACTGVQGLA